MSATRSHIAEVAESWVSTRYVHGQGVKGVAVDCANFVAAVAEESGAVSDIEFEREYRRREDGVTMLRLLKDYLKPVPDPRDAKVGDVLAFTDDPGDTVPRHLGIVVKVTEATTYICHASKKGVRRHRMDLSWWNRVHSAWEIEGVTDE